MNPSDPPSGQRRHSSDHQIRPPQMAAAKPRRNRRAQHGGLGCTLAAPFLALTLALMPPLARADAVDDLMAAGLQQRRLVGVSVAVVRNGEIVKTGAYGMADLELGVAVGTNTVFQIQSITKTFTSAAILLLAEEGKLSLDDPVGKYLPGSPGSWKGITIRHLLSHTSGIKDFINDPTASLRLDVTEEQVLQATAPRALNFAPGERYAYSNTNYHLLAMIIRKLTGRWYGDFLRERLFVPLGMHNTRPVSLTEIIPSRASGYAWTGSVFRNGDFIAESILAYGGGGILSTAPDMARWAQAMLEKKLLKPETLAEAWTPARLTDGTTTSYGLGWGVATVEGHREINHGGGHATGFTSFLALYPDDRLAVVVLLNRNGVNTSRLARRVAGLYIPELAPPPEKAIEDKEPKTTERLRGFIAAVPNWGLRRDQFTSEMWQVLESQRPEMQEHARALGPVRSIELLSRKGADGARTSRYRVLFAQGTVIVALTLDTDGRIAGLQANDEE